MNEYLLSVIGTVLLCTLLTAIMPEGKSTAVIKGIARLVCVLTIISPVLRFFKSGSIEDIIQGNEGIFFEESVIEKETAFIQYYSEMRVRETESSLEKEIGERYSLEVSVALIWELEEEAFADAYALQNLRIRQIRVLLPEKTNEEVRREIFAYLTENYRSEVLLE